MTLFEWKITDCGNGELTLPAECVPLNRLVLGDFYSSPS